MSVRDDVGNAQHFTFNADSNSNNVNKLMSESNLQKSVTNILRNHRLQYDTYWSFAGWAGSAATGQITTEAKFIGERSLKINKTAGPSRHFYSQEVTLEKGKTYNFSAYVKTNNITATNNSGAVLSVAYQNSTGAWIHEYSNYLNGTKNWTRLDLTFTVPANAASRLHPREHHRRSGHRLL